MNKETINLQSEIFKELRTQFDEVLDKTLITMDAKNTREAVITVKLDISLQDKLKINRITGERDDMLKPTFKHTISTAMHVKGKLKGEYNEEVELVYDNDEGGYIIKPLEDDQISIFDYEN